MVPNPFGNQSSFNQQPLAFHDSQQVKVQFRGIIHEVNQDEK